MSLGKADLFKAVQREHEAFEVAIGKLTLHWADAESALFCVLRYYSQTSVDVARAIFSGTRAKAMMDFISAIAHNTKLDPVRHADLRDIFPQLAAINTMRDRLTHHVDGSAIRVVGDDPRYRILSNEDRASRIGKGFNVKVGSTTLHDMCTDLRLICRSLLAHRDAVPFVPHYGAADAKSRGWAFKPPQSIVLDRDNQ